MLLDVHLQFLPMQLPRAAERSSQNTPAHPY